MKRDPFKQYLKDPENKAKLYLALTGAMILTTILLVIGTLVFILVLVGVI